MKNNQIPEIRFPEFKEAWEQHKLGNVFKKDTKKNKDLEFHSKDIISVSKMKNATSVRDSSDTYMTTYNKIRIGNIAFEGHANKEFPNGRFVLNDFKDGIVSHIYDVYSSISIMDKEFIKRYINNPVVMRRILINATSNARMMNSLNSKEFLKQYLLLPNIQEQIQIGTFFKQLDDTIALHQRKLKALKQTKQGFLQKMFPKDGGKVPEVRFPGYTDDWALSKLSVGMTEYTDRVFIQEDKNYKQVSVKNIGEIVLRGEKIGSKIGRKRQAKVNLTDHPNTLIFTRQTVEQGGIGFAPKETDGAIVTENMPTIDINEKKIDCNYLLAYVKTQEWYRHVILKNIEGGTAQVAIHEDSILSSEVLIPKIDEQQKIGSFFKKLGDTIALHKRELEILKNTKKAFLQKMFV